MLHRFAPAGQGGLSRDELIRCLARVLPLTETTRAFKPGDLTAPSTRRASVSSTYGKEMHVTSVQPPLLRFPSELHSYDQSCLFVCLLGFNGASTTEVILRP